MTTTNIGHEDILYYIARAYRRHAKRRKARKPVPTYVELGIYKGHTFNKVAPLCERAVGCDIRIRSSVLRAENVELYEMTTREFAQQWHDPIDFLFIDANHDYECAKADFDAFAPLVRPRLGIIALHDTFPSGRYAKRLPRARSWWMIADEIHRSPEYAEYEIVTLPMSNCGLSLVRRAPTHLDWNCDDPSWQELRDARI